MLTAQRIELEKIQGRLEILNHSPQSLGVKRERLGLEVKQREIHLKICEQEHRRLTVYEEKLTRELDQLRARLKEVTG